MKCNFWGASEEKTALAVDFAAEVAWRKMLITGARRLGLRFFKKFWKFK